MDQWRRGGYPSPQHPLIAEIFEWASDPETGTLRFLRTPQLRALEIYWYLRLVEGTPHIFALYQRLFPHPSELLEALGLTAPQITRLVVGQPLEPLWERIRTDDRFVREFRLESVRETLTLDYPSYILALAMGAGKTILIGAIFATEFAMAMEYPDGPFVQNALVFAPGKTIIESLRELAAVPYERILPPRLYKLFAASVKLTFTRDGEKDIPVVRGSLYNVVVTNTEKIRIQKETIRRSDLGDLLTRGREDEVRAEVANLRLQAIASLPHLAVFSDEAHHTYGQSLETELKKVRKTVDYLAANTKVVCVVNTTGTPYFRRQPLKDVVIWYGLSEGIRDGILKDVSGNIQAFDFEGNTGAYVSHVIEDFFRDYGETRLPNGAPAKLAIYFPQTDDLEELRPVVDAALVRVGQSPTLCLRNTSESLRNEVDAFNRLNDPAASHRVILLVNKGTEGWNCPSLFACALARKLRSSNNFVLQAATRCLRRVSGNNMKARIYLSRDNRSILDRQLQETYGETITDLDRATRETGSARLILRKYQRPPITLTRLVRTVVPAGSDGRGLRLERPKADSEGAVLTKAVLDIVPRQGVRSLLQQVGGAIQIEAVPDAVDRYEAAVTLAAAFRVDLWAVYYELRRLYNDGEEIPVAHLDALGEQLAEQTRKYEVREEEFELALALVKPEGFSKTTEAEGQEVYTAEITYPKERERLLLHADKVLRENPAGFGFHYDPYNFDSVPEMDFFQQMLKDLNLHPAEVEDLYFTGGLTDPGKTDFYVEYRGEEHRWHRYTPDFVIRKRLRQGGRPGAGKVLMVEIKDARFESAIREDERRLDRGEEPVTLEGRKAMALRRLERLNPNRLKYQLIFTRGGVTYEQHSEVRRFVREPEGVYEHDLMVAQRLKELILQANGSRVRRIILFGSRARGDARSDADFDLLVVLRDIAPGEKRSCRLSLYRLFQGAGVTADPWVMAEEEFEETKRVIGGLAYPAWKEGVLLYENP
ncbi:MAG: nucleotidyltransferase domain-containing protein [Candidatus Methylomirabilia bacterium]